MQGMGTSTTPQLQFQASLPSFYNESLWKGKQLQPDGDVSDICIGFIY